MGIAGTYLSHYYVKSTNTDIFYTETNQQRRWRGEIFLENGPYARTRDEHRKYII